MNTMEEIRQEMQAMEVMLVDKGYVQPEAQTWVRASGRHVVYVHAKLSDKASDIYNDKNRTAKALHGENLPQLIGDMWAWIREMKDVGEQRKEKVLRDLASLIDESNEVGMDIDFLNPLTTAMKHLSENVITDRRVVEEVENRPGQPRDSYVGRGNKGPS